MTGVLLIFVGNLFLTAITAQVSNWRTAERTYSNIRRLDCRHAPSIPDGERQSYARVDTRVGSRWVRSYFLQRPTDQVGFSSIFNIYFGGWNFANYGGSGWVGSKCFINDGSDCVGSSFLSVGLGRITKNGHRRNSGGGRGVNSPSQLRSRVK